MTAIAIFLKGSIIAGSAYLLEKVRKCTIKHMKEGKLKTFFLSEI